MHPPLQVSIREPGLIPLSCELVLAGNGMKTQRSRVGSLDEQEGARVSGVLLTGGGGMSLQAPHK